MLSHIYQIVYYFEQTHGYRPNTLYINQELFKRLRQELSEPDNIDKIMDLLDMSIVIGNDLQHPHVACLLHSWRGLEAPSQTGYVQQRRNQGYLD